MNKMSSTTYATFSKIVIMMNAKICHKRPKNSITLIDRIEDLEITLSADFDERSNTSFYTADNENDT